MGPGAPRCAEPRCALGSWCSSIQQSVRTCQFFFCSVTRSPRVDGRQPPRLPRPYLAPLLSRPDICDVVVSDIQILEPSTPASDNSSAAAAGHSNAGPAATCSAARHEGSTLGSAAAAGNAAGSAPGLASAALGCYQLPADVEQRVVLVDSQQGLDLLEAALFGGAGEGTAVDGAGNAGTPSGGTAGSSGADSDSGGDQPRGFGSGSVGAGGALAGSDGSTVRYRLVVGLDCEWQPYERGQPKSAVSLLQLATPEAVFLLDMLALCGTSDKRESSAGSGPGSSPDGGSSLGGSSTTGGSEEASSAAADEGSCGSSQAATVPLLECEPQQEAGAPATPADVQQLSLRQCQLSDLLARLLGDASIVKAGFGMGTDLQRLCESYPMLPCFGSQGSVPLR